MSPKKKPETAEPKVEPITDVYDGSVPPWIDPKPKKK